MGFNYTTTLSNPCASIEVTSNYANMAQLFGVKHFRVVEETTAEAGQNCFSALGIDATALTNYLTTPSALASFCAALTNGCAAYEMANEPDSGNPDPNWVNDLPVQAAQFAAAIPGTLPAAPIYGPSYTNANSIRTAAPVAFPTATPTAIPPIASNITYFNIHPYTSAFAPENAGFGGRFDLCGPYPAFALRCGQYGSLNYVYNIGETIGWGLPGVSTEGVASYGTYGNICGSGKVDFPTQQAYTQRGFLYAWMFGLKRSFDYKLEDDGGCTDGFGTFGLSNRITSGGVITSVNPKPALTGLMYFTQLLYDTGGTASTFTPAPLSYAILNPTTDLKSLLFADSDGSYRLVLWSNASMWNPNAGVAIGCNGTSTCGAQYAQVADNVTVQFAAPHNYTLFTQIFNYGSGGTTGQWQGVSSAGTTVSTVVTQFPQIIDIAAPSATPIPLPTNVPTPGPVETPSATPTPSGVFDLQDNGANPAYVASGTSVTATLPNAPTSGDNVLVFESSQSLGGSLTGPTGGTLLMHCISNFSNESSVWDVPDTGSLANSFTVSAASNRSINVGVMEITHLSSSSPPFVTTQNCTASQTEFTPGYMTPGAIGALPIGFFSGSTSTTSTFFNPSGYLVNIQYALPPYNPIEVLVGQPVTNLNAIQIGDGITSVDVASCCQVGMSLFIGP
jgi:hypothetical protein